MLRRLPELLQFVFVDVVTIAFRETIDENRQRLLPIQDDCPISTRLALAGSSNSLLDHATAEIGIDLAFEGSCHGIQQCAVGYAFLAGETVKPSILEIRKRSSLQANE
jgi:hypothetical protein